MMDQSNSGLTISPLTIKALIEQSIQKYPNEPALSYYDKTPITFSNLGEKIVDLSTQLKKYGVYKGDRIAILGENCPSWGIAYLSIATLGAVVVPILPDFPADDVHNILNQTESKLLFATKAQADKLLFESCKSIKSVIILDDFSVEKTGIHTTTFSEFIDDAIKTVSTFVHDIGEKTGLISAEVGGDDLAAIIYTSGTTGFSKGVMLTHANIVSNVVATTELIALGPPDRFLSVLPLSHAYECTMGFLLPLAFGSSVYYLGRPPTPSILKEACGKVRPTIIALVPLIMEKIYKKRVKSVFEKNFLVRGITKTPFAKKFLYKKAVRKIIDFLGGEIKTVAFGGAAINSEVENFLIRGGFPFVVGYGLTETSPLATGSPLGKTRRGTAGYAINDVDVKIEDPHPKTGIGEIYLRGPNVMKGYYKNKKLTQEILDEEGWFKTGDRGYLDKDKYLYIMGRSKNMFLGSGGENIYPEVIEEKLNAVLIVQESLAIENRGDIEALVYLDPNLLEPELTGKSEQEQEKTVSAILEKIRREVNQNLAAFSRIRRCHYQSEPFQKTATQKIKRYLYYHPDFKENK